MKNVALALSFVAFTCAANAQLSLLPQVGFENSKTIIRYNDASTFSPLGVTFSPQASLRLNYASRQGHGFFLGVATSRSVVSFKVADPENTLDTYTAENAAMQWKFEGGYRFSTKPITLGKSNAKQAAAKKTAGGFGTQNRYAGHCGRSCVGSRCGYGRSRTERIPEKKKNVSWVRIQPSIGMGFIPSVKTDVVTKTDGAQTSFEYRAGNWNTALVTGADFEFGRNRTRLFTVSVNYFNGMGNLGKRTIATTESSKTTTNILQSDVSGWNLRVGIPFMLGKKPAKSINKNPYRSANKCGQYRSMHRCGRSI